MYLNAAQRADRRPRLASVLAGAAPGPRVEDQLAVFRDRELGREVGSCLRCGKPIRSQG